jgi:hypothetical protein
MTTNVHWEKDDEIELVGRSDRKVAVTKLDLLQSFIKRGLFQHSYYEYLQKDVDQM